MKDIEAQRLMLLELYRRNRGERGGRFGVDDLAYAAGGMEYAQIDDVVKQLVDKGFLVADFERRQVSITYPGIEYVEATLT